MLLLLYCSPSLWFRSRDSEDTPNGYTFELRLGAFNGAIGTTIEQATGNGQQQDTTDLENLLDAADNKTFLQFDGRFRMGFYHQIQLGYFDLRRQSATTLVNDLNFDDQIYLAGTDIETSTEFSVLRTSYGYSLMRDGQKELAVKAGLSYVRFEAELGEVGSGQKQQVSTSAPLPTIGAIGTLPLGSKWLLGADLDLFALDFERYSGFMGYLSVDLARKFGDVFKLGVGYNFYTLSLSAKDEALGGELDLRIHGPKAYVSFTF